MMLSMLGKNFGRQLFEIFFLTIYMKCQSLFPENLFFHVTVISLGVVCIPLKSKYFSQLFQENRVGKLGISSKSLFFLIVDSTHI